jgi:hypothetical protein
MHYLDLPADLLLGHRNTATTKNSTFKNSHLTSVGAIFLVTGDAQGCSARHILAGAGAKRRFFLYRQARE